MKRVVRSNCFETNSSSVHAIVIDRRSGLQNPDSFGIGFTLGQFRWEWKNYNTIEDRASYLWTAIVCSYSEDTEDDTNYRTEKALEWAEYIKSAIRHQFGSDVDIYFQWPKPEDWFDIDHFYALREWLDHLKEDEEDLLLYLFGKGSVIRTGNDNSDDHVDYSCPEYGWVYVKTGG